MPENSFDRAGVFDQRKKPQPAATARTMEPREPASQATAGQEVAELLFDESRQPFTIPKRRGLCAERLEVFDDNLMKHAVSRMPRLVAAGRVGHSTPAGGPHANRRSEKSGLNRRTARGSIAVPARPLERIDRSPCHQD
jgi:hypothetical protein